MKYDLIDERPRHVYFVHDDIWTRLMPICHDEMKNLPSDVYGGPAVYDGEADDLVVWPKMVN